MEITGFEHLHLHSHFSLLDGYGAPEEYSKRAKEINQRYLSISDHGVMGAVPRQIKTCEEYKISPIFSCELYTNPMQPELKIGETNADFFKNLSDFEKPKFRKSYHLLGIAYNVTGYSNLVKLSSLGYKKGFYYRPRVNREQIMAHKEGIIFTSCCYNSEIGQAFDKEGEEAAFQMVELYKSMFGENFYLELMLLDFSKQKPYDAFIIKAAEKYKLPMIITNDCHVCLKEDIKMQNIMMMMQTKTTMQEVADKVAEDGDAFEIQDKNLYMKSEQEINEKWASCYKDIIDYEIFKEAKRNTVRICEKAKGVETQMDRSIKLPEIQDAEEKLLEAIDKGFTFRCIPRNQEYESRAKEEYELIKQKGFCSYFLIQKMITDEAKRIAPILSGYGDGSEAVGPGRGCLQNDVPIRLENGSTTILESIKVGDKIWTIDGSAKKVLKTMKYPLNNENVRRIKTYYGDDIGVTLTLDHKIYASKNDIDLSWIHASELSVGDWCFVPFIKHNNNYNNYIKDNKDYFSLIKGVDMCDDHLVYRTNNYELAEITRFSLYSSFHSPCSIEKIENEYVLKYPIKINDNWKIAKDGLMLRIKSIEEFKGPDFVYDLEIEDNHNYLTSSFLVHNSVAGSLIAYAIGLTDVDPIKHELLFSRFLSPARGGKSMKIKFSSDPIKKLEQNIDLNKTGEFEECPFT